MSRARAMGSLLRAPASPRRTRCKVARLPAVLAAALGAVIASAAAGQEFDAPEPPWPATSAATLLERALPAAEPSLAAEAFATRWYGIEALTTRSFAVAGSWRSFRWASGVSTTGEPEVGWTGIALAAGFAQASGGAGVRAIARRDRTTDFGFDSRGAEVGADLGAGAWVEAGADLHVWASAPQLWSGGAMGPVPRGLEIGIALRRGATWVWLGRAAPAAAYAAAGHRAGLATGVGPLTIWIFARDAPARGGLGVRARAAGLDVAAAIESHPVLAETVRLEVGWGRPADDSPPAAPAAGPPGDAP